jgi:hypothetical protein
MPHSFTFYLTLLDYSSKLFPALSVAGADRRSSDMVFRKNAFFIVENRFSGCAVVIVVWMILSRQYTPAREFWSPLFVIT